MIQLLTEKDILDKYKSGAMQSKFLIIALLNQDVLYRKDVYFEVEMEGIVDAFINGLWTFKPETTLTVKVYLFPDLNLFETYTMEFMKGGMTVEIRTS